MVYDAKKPKLNVPGITLASTPVVDQCNGHIYMSTR